MSANIEYLYDKDGNIILPKTVTKAITDENGNRLDKVLGQPNMDMVMLGWSVPIDCPIKNYVDDNRVFHQLVGRVDLSTINWTRYDIHWENYGFKCDMKEGVDLPFYSTYPMTQLFYFAIAGIRVYSTETTTPPSGYLYYELAQEITTPVDGNEIVNTISDAYNPTKNYSIGEFCIYKNKLWKSKVANNVGNIPAEGTYWTATNVSSELSSIINRTNSRSNPLVGVIKPYAPTAPTTGTANAESYDFAIQNNVLYIRSFDANGTLIAWHKVNLTNV